MCDCEFIINASRLKRKQTKAGDRNDRQISELSIGINCAPMLATCDSTI